MDFSLQNVTFFATLVSNLECHLQFKSSFMVLLVRHAWRRYVSDRCWGKNPEEKKLILAKSHYMIKKPLRPKKQQEEPSRSPPAQLRIWLTLNKVFRISSEIRHWLVFTIFLKTLKDLRKLLSSEAFLRILTNLRNYIYEIWLTSRPPSSPT